MIESGKKFIFDLDFDDLVVELETLGEPSYRARQIWRGLYKDFWASFQGFTNLPTQLRTTLGERFDFSHLKPDRWIGSADGETCKTMFVLPDELAIEAVMMRYRDRKTLCISSQAGCPMGCVFCATGQMGFRRNLTSGEIVEQVIFYLRQLSSSGEKVTNIVLMGMGEPFLNYDATISAVERLNDPEGADFGSRRFTISTVGIVPAIQRFTNEKRQVNLAISLHAADDDLRSSLMPVNRKYPIKELIGVCQEYVEMTHRRITFEWALIQGVNDSRTQAAKLAELLSPFISHGSALCHVNVIPLNPTQKYGGKPTPRVQAYAFQAMLEEKGVPCTVRTRRGIAIQAGCGQLATS